MLAGASSQSGRYWDYWEDSSCVFPLFCSTLFYVFFYVILSMICIRDFYFITDRFIRRKIYCQIYVYYTSSNHKDVQKKRRMVNISCNEESKKTKKTAFSMPSNLVHEVSLKSRLSKSNSTRNDIHTPQEWKAWVWASSVELL